MIMTTTELTVCLVILILSGCYFGWRCFMRMLDGDVSRVELFFMLASYAGGVAISAHMGGWFSL